MANHTPEQNKTLDKDWAEVRELPGHKRTTSIQDPDNPLYDPKHETDLVEQARYIAGHPVLDTHFVDSKGNIPSDPIFPGRRNRWVEVRGNGANDGWTPIKRDQKILNGS